LFWFARILAYQEYASAVREACALHSHHPHPPAVGVGRGGRLLWFARILSYHPNLPVAGGVRNGAKRVAGLCHLILQRFIH
jgi:hypothetical protein